MSEHTLLEHEAIKLKTFGQEAKLSDKLVELRNEGLELRRQVFKNKIMIYSSN